MIYLTALLAGFLMNFMPCVAPVLALKLRAFGQPGKRIPYLAGVMASFMVLATLSVTLGTGLSQMGLEPFRLTLGVVCGLMATHLLGLWHMPSLGVRGDWGPFGTGILTVALGTSCSVPFLAPVMIYCGQAGVLETFGLFGALGVGFCGPFILPIPIPKLFRGDWSLFFERACGCIMCVVALWIFSTVSLGVSTYGLCLIFGLVCLAKVWQNFDRLRHVMYFRWIVPVVTIILVAWGVTILTPSHTTETTPTWTTTGPRCIFFTADWCINCKAAYQTVKYDGIEDDLRNAGIVGGVEVVDFTDQNLEISAKLVKLSGSPSVPVIWIIRSDGVETILTGLWFVSDVRDALVMPTK
jgi:thiol:disulfide interchange protein DsbD